jgi:hypothetical protein
MQPWRRAAHAHTHQFPSAAATAVCVLSREKCRECARTLRHFMNVCVRKLFFLQGANSLSILDAKNVHNFWLMVSKKLYIRIPIIECSYVSLL